MPTRLLLLLCLTGHVFAKEPPDVDCLVVHIEYVHCSWNKQGTPEVNYTFYGWFENENRRECTTYLSEHGTITGCNHRYLKRINKFSPFHTKLQHGDEVFEMQHELKHKADKASVSRGVDAEGQDNASYRSEEEEETDEEGQEEEEMEEEEEKKKEEEEEEKEEEESGAGTTKKTVPVKLYPPTNLTVKMESDANLWFYWNQSYSGCVESEARYRINNKIWNTDSVSTGSQNYCINLPSNSSLYEVQVRSKFGRTCAESNIWSNWSEPVSWGNNNSTVKPHPKDGSMSVWTPVMYVLGALTLILMVMMLLHHERVRFIPVPVPKLTFNFKEEWFQESNCLKSESFYPNYNEHVCPVSEYSPVSQSSSDSSDCSTSSFTTDQTDCSIVIPSDGSDLSTSCSSSTSTVSVSSEEAEKVSV